MHILIVNDDGPPSNHSSPYVHPFVHTLQAAGHTVSVVLPNQQRSWIGKAHFVGAVVKPTYYRPGTLYRNDGTVHHLPRGSDNADNADGIEEEWILINSTPAACTQIGLYHYFQDRGPVDLVVSGPNFGRNTTALFSLSSGTIGAALEAAVCGKKAIALSFAFTKRIYDRDPVAIAEATSHSARLIQHFYDNWTEGVDVYSINIPLEPGVSKNKILYTPVLANRWADQSCFVPIDPDVSSGDPELKEETLREQGEGGDTAGKMMEVTPAKKPQIQHRHFKWEPNVHHVYESVDYGEPGNDGLVLKGGMTSVTPLKANYMHAPGLRGEIKLYDKEPAFYFLMNYGDKYVQPILDHALKSCFDGIYCKQIAALSELPDPSSPVLQYRQYEELDFGHVLSYPMTSMANSFIIRKALIRKHFLSSTVINWISKHPNSVLRNHLKHTTHFELDYAEFLDEALTEAYELHESMETNETRAGPEKVWWILKPGMSDRGQGIRLFNSETQLREIFEEWESDESDMSSNDDLDGAVENYFSRTWDEKENLSIVTSQLRHFIAQPYIHPPLLLPSSSGRKFHIRTYVLAVGSLKVYVFKEMLALFAAKPYLAPWEEEDNKRDLTRHLTNTCLQGGGSPNQETVKRFWALEDDVPTLLDPTPQGWKHSVFDQICGITGEIFQAASRGMLVHFQTLPNVFEVFGLDFLVDGEGIAWLLEINAFPDFAQTGEELKEVVIRRLFEGVMELAVKPFFLERFPSITTTTLQDKDKAQGKEESGPEHVRSGGGGGGGPEDFKLVADLDLGR